MTGRRLSQAALKCLRQVNETGLLHGRQLLTAMLKTEGYVEDSGVVRNHFRLYQLTARGHYELDT